MKVAPSNAAGPPSATARFYDAGNNLIASADITIAPNCTWTWSGWEASGGPVISRVEVLSDRPDAAFIMMDDMEIDFGDPISTGYYVSHQRLFGFVRQVTASGQLNLNSPPGAAPRITNAETRSRSITI